MAAQISGELWIFSKQYQLPRDADAVLGQIAGAGYTSVEAEPGALPAELLKKRGLHVACSHTVLPRLLDMSTLTRGLDEYKCHDLSVSGLLEWHERSADDYRRAADVLARGAAELARAGVRLHYHNHDFEFDRVEGDATGYDLLLRNAGPELKLCADLGWVWYAGLDPLAFMRQHGDRIGIVHFRDFAGRASVPLGAGEMVLEPLLATVKERQGIRHIVVEQDPSADPAGDMAISLRWLKARIG